jgi:hypothetical protein
MLVKETLKRCRSGQERVDGARRRLAHRHRLLNRAWWTAGASDGEALGTTGVIHIDCRKHLGEPSEYLLSFGGNRDGVGAFYLGKAIDPLTAFLRNLGVRDPATRTALQVLMAEPHHKIQNVTLTRVHIRELGL